MPHFASFSHHFPITFSSIDVRVASFCALAFWLHAMAARFLVRKEQSWRKAELEVKEMSVQLEVLCHGKWEEWEEEENVGYGRWDNAYMYSVYKYLYTHI